MKSRLILIGALAIIFGACSTGSQITSSDSDDIYFNPGDVPPPITVTTETVPIQGKSDDVLIISQIEKNDDC